MAHRAFTTHPLVVRRVTVRRIEEVTPRMRRVVVGGPGLAEAVVDGHPQPAFTSPGFDDHIKLILAPGADIDSALPAQLEHGIEWTPSETRVTRDYTPRRVDLEHGEIDLDFVRHGDGPAARWADRARVGDELAFVGPKSSLRFPQDVEWILLVADETGLPAVGRFLDERPLDAPAHIVLLVEDDSARQSLALRDGDTVSWHVASAGDPGPLEAAVRAVRIPDGAGYAWAAAESRALLPVRRYLQREAGLPKDRLNITGYWHAAPAEADGAGEPVAAAPEIASPVPWLVTRAAVQLGLVDALADGPAPGDVLAARMGIPAPTLAGLLPVLAEHGVVVDADGFLALGPVGEGLLDDHEREEFTGFEADLALSLVQLASALHEGVPAWRRHTGQTVAEAAETEVEIARELVEHGGRLAYLSDGLIPELADLSSALLIGPGSAAIVHALEDAGRSDIALSVLDRGALRDVLHGAVEGPGSIAWMPRESDVAILSFALDHRTGTESAHILSEAARYAPRAILIESTRPDTLGGGAGEAHAAHLARTGSPYRGAESLARIAETAGWRSSRSIELGWGVEALLLERR
ncbi:siderophore-interacting protein [Microbacterium marinilacus]|uniref:FAD-binding FR-type domain-containing protein n=1 Tax=Microbacterium marinilacus TaxID=415209 RepID=A0ABP7BEX0_9MICO|nr:siderophore-interacting protein [Microbacterium marinilacus]MBY0689001.1 siderophore-interacting protein [Microbacterium marinilacus]